MNRQETATKLLAAMTHGLLQTRLLNKGDVQTLKDNLDEAPALAVKLTDRLIEELRKEPKLPPQTTTSGRDKCGKCS